MSNIKIRKTKLEQIDQAMEMIRESQKQMNQQNNYQWSENYPSRGHILKDFESDSSYMLQLDGEIIGTLAMLEPEAAGGDLVKDNNGEKLWINDDDNYMLLCRSTISIKLRNKGFGTLFLEEVERMCRQKKKTSIRGLTDKNNIPIIKLFSKLNYQILGEVYNPTFDRSYVALEKILDYSSTQ